MIRWTLPLAALLAGEAAMARFAPRLGTPYRLTRVEEREDGGAMRRFVATRRVTFTRAAEGGYVARLLLEEASDSRADSAFGPLARAMADAPLTIELDRDGRVRRVRDLDAIWARMREGIARAATDPQVRAAVWRMHDAATTDERTQVIAGPLLAVIVPDDRATGTRRVTLPAQGVGPKVPMMGEETVRRGHGETAITTMAAARSEAGTRTLRRDQLIDRRTGLVTEQHDEQRLIVIGGDDRRTVRTSAQITFR